VRWADDALAGRLELDGIGVLAGGGVELRGLRVFDPDDRLVLRVERARLSANVLGLANRELDVSLELDGLDVDAARRAEDGTLALARAFAPARRTPPRRGAPAAERPAAEGERGGAWSLRLSRLTATGGRASVASGSGEPVRLEEVALDARGRWARGSAWLELRAGGALQAPAKAPVSLALRATREGDRVELQRLEAGVGEDRLEAVGEGDLARRSGRLAVTRFGLSAQDTGALARGARLGGDLSGTFYAESDGRVLTAAAIVRPVTKGAAGSAEVAIAARVPPDAGGWGLAADVDRLDPSRLSLLAPPGSVTLRGRGAWRGTELADVAGRVAVRLERSRLRGGELGPIEVTATAGGGSVEISRLEASAPGGSVSGQLRWSARREVSGRLTVEARDLERLERNVAALLGTPVPDLGGAGRATVSLSGTAKAPRLDATVEAARIVAGPVRAEGARLHVSVAGPPSTASGEVTGALARARVAGLDLRGVELAVALREEQASLSLTALVPRLGTDPVRAMLRGKFADRRRAFELADALVAWPGTRFALEHPARLDLSAPATEKLALVAGAQRIEAEGGVRRGGKLEGRLRLTGLDLARLPRGLAPPDAAPEGIVTVDARVSGARGAPHVEATVGVTSGSVFQVGGLELLGDVTWDGALERIEADLGLMRARGGAIDVSLDVPVALADARESEELRVEVHGKGVPLDELVWLAGSYALISGEVDLSASLTGSVGSPELHASATVRNGSWEDLEELALDATADTPGDRLRIRANGSLGGAPAASLDGELALDLARLLTRPRDAIAAARRGASSLTLRVPGVELKRLAGRLDLPADLAGRLSGEAAIAGTFASPRGTARISVDDAAALGARRVGGQVVVTLAPERTGAILDLRLAGSPALRLDGTIELPAKRLFERGALATAPVRVDTVVPRSDLAAWGGEVASLRGWVEGKGSLRGTLGAPQAQLSVSASGAVVEGRPLGDVTIEGRHAARRSTVHLDLRPPGGGALRADLTLEQPLGIGTNAGPVRAAPAELRVRADRLDLGFLPALAPGVVRVAAGAASFDLTATGSLAELKPLGTLRVAKGRLAIAELGEWTDATIEADFGADTVELRRFDVRKGSGTLSLRGTLRGLARRDAPAELEATLRAQDFGVERAGMEFARIDATAEARGQLDRTALTLGVVIPQAEVKLPKRVPRTLQETGTRKDITVGRPRPRRSRRGEPAAAGAAAVASADAAPSEPFRTVLHVVAPRRLRVRADQPRIDVELKADAIFAFAGSRSEATGSIQSIRGHVEPIGGRVFVLERGKVTFTGGPVETGTLDLAARYDNPTAVVRATVGGTVRKPVLHLASEPPMQEAQIAMLVATGRAEVRPGTESINTLAAGEAGLAAAGAVATGVFKDLLSDKLPVDSVSLDSTAVRAGKYLTDRIYVGYVRRFDAKPEKGENPDEIRMDYQLAPGWQVETRYGNGQSGSASIVWTRNY
jgi:translocation and assembly module TamB